MEKMILEASARFEEKFQVAKEGQNVNVAAYGGSDRTYNLRSQIQHVPQLQQDKHFMEMVAEVDKYTSPEWTLRGDVEKRLYSLLGGLLKGLLRECISSSDVAMRKINIEKCWNWYKDKRKLLLDWKMDRRGGTPSTGDGKMATTTPSRRGEDGADASEEAPRDKLDDAQSPDVSKEQVRTPAFQPPPQTVSKFKQKTFEGRVDGAVLDLNYMQQEEEQQRATNIVKKLQLYQKRNLKKSLQHRVQGYSQQGTPEKGMTPSKSFTGGAPGDLSSVSGALSASPPSPSVKVVYRDKDKPKRADLSPSHSPVLVHTLKDSVVHRHNSPPKGNPEFNEKLASVQKIWVAKRAQEAEEKLDEMEFKDTISMWSYNQSRIEEEINRRKESYQMSSQTGKTCHTILRRPNTAPELNSLSSAGNSFIDLSMASVASVDKAKPDRGLAGTPPLKKITFQDGEGTGLLSTLDSGGGKGVISLSPYDNFNPKTDNKSMRLLTPAPSSEIATPDQGNLSSMKSKGLVHTHPTALRSTSFLNSNLDVTANVNTIFAPSMLAGIGKLPAKANLDDDDDAAAAGSRPKGGDKKKQAAAAGGKDKPKPGGKKGPAKKSGPINPFMLEQIFPVLTVEQEVPSLMRMQQMQQVESIREAFAKYGMSVPTSIIEHGILTPEDRPYSECMTDLPAPEFGLVRDFTKKREKAKGGKSKGKKKG
jgi:hypothetical protein